MEPQQGRYEEHFSHMEWNQCGGRQNRLCRNNDPYLDEEEQEEEEYPSNDRYNPRGERRYDNRHTTNNRGGQVEPRSYDNNRQSRNQRTLSESSEEEWCQDSCP